MNVLSLKFFNFRNIHNGEVGFEPGVNVIVGKNGQGKTNLVEAINLLSSTKSFRTSDLKETIRWGETSASVFAKVENEIGEIDLGVLLEPRGRSFLYNGDKVNHLTQFLGKLVCISFTPSDLALVQGSPAERRKFVDKHMVDLTPALMSNLVNYSRALKNKLKLLKDGITDLTLLESWNSILAREASIISKSRAAFVESLEANAQNIQREFSLDDGKLTLRIKSNLSGHILSEEEIFERLQDIRQREVYAHACLLGPHRDDLSIELGGRDALAYASQGQSRSIVLSLTLGVIELLEKKHGESPVVLLDDVNSELDAKRSDSFFNLVVSQERQIFVTGTDASVSHLRSEEGYNVVRVESGRIESSPHTSHPRLSSEPEY